MKTQFILAFLLFLSFAVSAQQKGSSIFEKKEGDKNIVVVHNGSNTTSDTCITSAKADSTTLMVFFKPGCSRCESFLKMLIEKNIRYTSIDMSTDDPRIPQMWQDIHNQGFNGGTIRYPIIRYQGTVIWEMIDMNAFIERLPH